MWVMRRRHKEFIKLTVESPHTAIVLKSAQAVADSLLCQNPAWLVGPRLELLTKLAHKDPQVLEVIEVVCPPHSREKLAMSDDAARISNEALKQFEFFWGQLHRLARHFDGMCKYIDRQVVDRICRRFAGLLGWMAQCSPKPRQEFTHGERFVDVVVGTENQSFDLFAFLSSR